MNQEYSDNNFIPKEISWLAFNDRVLQEGSDSNVPLIERMKFLGIYSSNLDEFFRVRVATLKRLVKMGKRGQQIIGHDPIDILRRVKKTVVRQHKRYNSIFNESLKELANNHIHFVDEMQLNPEQQTIANNYFSSKVRPELSPTIFTKSSKLPDLETGSIYLAVIMKDSRGKVSNRFVLIEVPTKKLKRFFVLPKIEKENYIIFLDDIIRNSMKDIFHFFPHDSFEAYTIKLSRDSELDLDDDISDSYVHKMSKSLHKRFTASPVRFVYDEAIPDYFLQIILTKLKISGDDTLIPGGRYHNRSDFMNFPKLGSSKLSRKIRKPIHHPGFDTAGRLTDMIKKKDLLLHVPYQSFTHFFTFLREAAIDPKVKSIKITLYRLGKTSSIVSALKNAIQNGKKVTVILELQARFDERANIYWGDILQDTGAKVLFGVPGLKVHSKLCLVSRREGKNLRRYAVIGTGNFNEDTADIYEDFFLFTSKDEVTKEVNRVFRFFKKHYRQSSYDRLLVAPFNYRKKISELIDLEIENAKLGQKAEITIKVNHLGDHEIIEKLYSASLQGVKICAIIRTMYCALPTDPNLTENFSAMGIVDGFLEHSRYMIFHNAGKPIAYLGSGDWLPRNFDNRVEVFVPILDKEIKDYLLKLTKIYLKDNTKARLWDRDLKNRIRETSRESSYQAQKHIYKKLKAIYGK